MKQEMMQKLPAWVYSDDPCDLVVTDDLDSLIGCLILNQYKNHKIKYFYDFKTVYRSRQLMDEYKRTGCISPRIWVDAAMTNERCFDNHLSVLSDKDEINHDCVNINQMLGIDRSNYYEKYNLSTALLLWSIYDVPIPKSEEGKMILLCIDSSFAGYYWYNGRYRNTCKKFLVDILELPELYKCLECHTESEFQGINAKFNLKRKINSDDGIDQSEWIKAICEELNLPALLPKNHYEEWFNLQTYNYRIDDETKKEDFAENIFSFAVTRKNKCKFSLII